MTSFTKTQIQRGYNQQVEHGRTEQAPQDDDGHRVFDLLTGDIAANHQGHQGQPGCQRRHHDRCDPLTRAALDKGRAKGFALLLFQMLEVADHHDSISGGDPQDSEQPDERTERKNATT